MGFKLAWDQAGKRKYETGVDRGVLFVQNVDGTYDNGVAWNGLTGVTETPSGAEETKLYADNMKYLALRSAEEFGGTIEAYTYPDEWQLCDGSANLGGLDGVHIGQQARRAFGFAYRTAVGNDTALNDYGYKLHLVYGATVSPSERAYATINDSPEAITFSWEFSTTPVEVGKVNDIDFKPTAILTIDTTELTDGKDNAKLATLEAKIYGTGYTYTKDTTVTSSNFDSKKSSLYVYDNGEYKALANDATFSSSVVYYTRSGSEVEPTLPLPSEVYTIFATV